eukprot:Platyproteum_vivax@DN8448_c0_g1_i1.p1
MVEGKNQQRQIHLVSRDDKKFTVDAEVAALSAILRNMIEESSADEEIPLPNVRGEMLEKVLSYCEYHRDKPAKELPRPLLPPVLGDHVDEFDVAFVDVDVQVLYEYVIVANYLDIKPLLDLCCAKMATMMKGKSIEEVRQLFNIVNDFTPEEENKIRMENRWCDPAFLMQEEERRRAAGEDGITESNDNSDKDE